MAFPLVALLALVLAGCSGSGVSSGDIEASQSNERWELRMRIPGEVRAGEMTAVELSLKNVSSETLRARAHTDCISRFDLIALDANGAQVFLWTNYVIETEYNGVAPQCPLIFEELAPGETLEDGVSFLVDEPGEYAVRPLLPRETVGNTSVPIELSLSVKVRAR
jgi:hypothetical protein